MKNKILSFAVLIFATATSFAQNSAIYKAEELMNDEELIKAQSVITPALTNPKTKLLGYAYNVAGNIECRLLQPEILKAADHQALDTTLFVNSLNAAAKYFIESDKIYKAMPKHNAEAKEKMADNKNMMRQILSYFAYAGQFENQRGNKKGAYESFEKFIALPQCPIFTEEETKAIYDKDRELYNRIGYIYLMFCGFVFIVRILHYAMNIDIVIEITGICFTKQCTIQIKDSNTIRNRDKITAGFCDLFNIFNQFFFCPCIFCPQG